MVNKYTIRLANVEETYKIIDMLKRIAQWMKNNGIQQWQYLLMGGDDNEITQAIEKEETFVVLDHDKIVATFTINATQSEWDHHIFGKDKGNSFFIHRLAILPTYMGQGLGVELLNWIYINFNNQKKWLKLDFVASNRKLVDFYSNNGFIEIGETDGHKKFIKRLQGRMEECLGCRLVAKKLPVNVVYENKDICCILDHDPYNEGHVLILPIKHFEDVDDLDLKTAHAIMEASMLLSKALKNLYKPDGIVINQNGGIFSELSHYHMHVVPRHQDRSFEDFYSEVSFANDDLKEKTEETKNKVVEEIGRLLNDST